MIGRFSGDPPSAPQALSFLATENTENTEGGGCAETGRTRGRQVPPFSVFSVFSG
jgi:hypothetical protein